MVCVCVKELTQLTGKLKPKLDIQKAKNQPICNTRSH